MLRPPQHGDGDWRMGEETREPLRMATLNRSGSCLQELRVDSGEEIASRKRLDEIVVGGSREPFEAGFFAGPGRQQQHGDGSQVRVSAEFSQQAEAIELRHHDIGDDDVGPPRARSGQRLDDRY